MPGETLPLVTAITPAYNRADLLAETIDSVLNQTYPHVEYIVLDDGSTDHTLDVLRGYDGRLRWETHPNMGEARTVNRGFALAQGEYVVVVNSDDPIMPNMIATLVAYMEQHPEVLVVYPDWIEIDLQSQPFNTVRAADYDYRGMVRWMACLPGPGALIRRRALALAGGRSTDYRYVTDLEFWLRVGLHGPLAHVPLPLATHRHHAASAGVQHKAVQGAEIVAMAEAFFQRDDLPPDIAALRAEALSAAHYTAALRTRGSRRLVLMHSWASLRLCPRRWLWDTRFRPSILLYVLLPDWIYEQIQKKYRQSRFRV